MSHAHVYGDSLSMNNTVIYAHPYDRSFNYAILDAVIQSIDSHGEKHTVIDLCKDKFDPVMSAEDLRSYMKGKTNDPLKVTQIRTAPKRQFLS